MSKNNPTAALIIIGNEILSGRTQDKNLNFIAKELSESGISFLEARIIPDIEQTIVDTVNELRTKYSYIFTTGGIGPTHDDITTLAIAKAFGVNIIRRSEVVENLKEYYASQNKELNDARLKMADFPDGAELLDNPISTAPGFKIGNVFVMAGIPNIMQAMFACAKAHLKYGQKFLSLEIAAFVGESKIAMQLTSIQEKYSDVGIGSYPFVRESKFGTSIVMRAVNEQRLDLAYQEIYQMLEENGEIIA